MAGKQRVGDFWARVIGNINHLKDQMIEKDAEVLKHCRNVETETKDDDSKKQAEKEEEKIKKNESRGVVVGANANETTSRTSALTLKDALFDVCFL